MKRQKDWGCPNLLNLPVSSATAFASRRSLPQVNLKHHH
jgi:hypothetical protein